MSLSRRITSGLATAALALATVAFAVPVSAVPSLFPGDSGGALLRRGWRRGRA